TSVRRSSRRASPRWSSAQTSCGERERAITDVRSLDLAAVGCLITRSARSSEGYLDGDIALRVVPVDVRAVLGSELVDDVVHGRGIRDRRRLCARLDSAGADADRRGLEDVPVPVAFRSEGGEQVQLFFLLDEPHRIGEDRKN